jgi:hypothetical protein
MIRIWIARIWVLAVIVVAIAAVWLLLDAYGKANQ